MADRYDDAVRVLRDVPAPDQWLDIESRTLAPGNGEARLVSLDAERARRRPGWPVLTAAAAVLSLAVLGATNMLSQGTSNVTEVDPAEVPERDGRVVAPPRSTTSTTPSTTEEEGGDEPEPEAEPDREYRGEAVAPPPPSSEDEETETSTTVPMEPFVTDGCQHIRMTSTNAPSDLDQTQQEPTPEDPRVHEAAWSRLIGVFDSEGADRAVFVVSGFGFGEDGGRWVDVPGPIEEAWIAHSSSSGQGIVELTLPDDDPCEITLLSSGLDEEELVEFVQGLEQAR